jgi:hypothetical protein
MTDACTYTTDADIRRMLLLKIGVGEREAGETERKYVYLRQPRKYGGRDREKVFRRRYTCFPSYFLSVRQPALLFRSACGLFY